MQVKLLHHTPLWVADKAIGKCWDKPSIDTTVNVERIERVANKNKHSSTIEHLVMVWIIEDNDLIQIFKENPFSQVSNVNSKIIVSSNARALQNLDLSKDILKLLSPKEYRFLFGLIEH